MILQVPACLLISKFWLDDIVGELTLDGKMQDLSLAYQFFNTGSKKRESFIRLVKIIPQDCSGEWRLGMAYTA